MTFTTQVKKITKSKPFYALAGAGGYAIEKLRMLRARRGELGETAKDLPDKTREAVAKDLPGKARGYADTAAAKFNEFYDDLAVHGREIVSKVSREAAHELEGVSESAKPASTPEARKPLAKAPARGRKTTSKV
jgi:hypothetical protein